MRTRTHTLFIKLNPTPITLYVAPNQCDYWETMYATPKKNKRICNILIFQKIFEIVTLIHIYTYSLTYVRQLLVTCYVHTINSTTLYVMQWMQLFLPCNEMPASGPCPLRCSELAYRSCV